MSDELQLPQMIEKMRHLISYNDSGVEENFQQPSLLKPLPSFTSNNTLAPKENQIDAELGEYSRRDKR